ncbi:hypothetical protein ACFYVL_28300 [Streptomyces sp. NPDC004111]|uniref:hypothetical protein n=1 Tax=Streptomyces sp. NPDC004111 TaxID=3364690 RepID=UPI0036827EC3
MGIDRTRQPRWPARALAALFLLYGLGKAVFAAQGKLGFPGGPTVPAEEYATYAADMMDVTAAQWLAASNGLAGALLFLVAASSMARRIPRPVLLPALAVASVGIGAGMVVLVADGLLGLGVGWRWYHALLGLTVLALLALALRSYLRTVRRAPAAP